MKGLLKVSFEQVEIKECGPKPTQALNATPMSHAFATLVGYAHFFWVVFLDVGLQVRYAPQKPEKLGGPLYGQFRVELMLKRRFYVK